MAIKKTSRTTRSRVASVSSLIEFRAKLQAAASDPLKIVGGSFRNDRPPLGDGGPADAERPCNVSRLFEVGNDIDFVHGRMLTIVPPRTQPCSHRKALTLVDMKNWQSCKSL